MTRYADTARHAIAAAERGWHVFPCEPGGKRPVVTAWEQRALHDPGMVARCWPPGANVGIATGPSGLVVIDLDTHGTLPDDWKLPGLRDGRDVFAQLIDWAGQDWMPTWWVITPSGGWHLYFTAPSGSDFRNTSGKLGPLIDTRARGGYVVGAGSVAGGSRYELAEDCDPAPLPGWLARVLADRPEPAPAVFPAIRLGEPGRRVAGLVRTVEDAPEGQRNAVLHWASCRAGEMTAEGEDPGQLAAELIAAAGRAGLPPAEARRTVASGMRGSHD